MTATPPDTGLACALGTVHEAMTGEVLVLTADTPADVAVRRLERAGVSGAPVVGGRRVVGVVTLRDLLTPIQLAGPTQTSGPFLRYEHLLAGLRVGDLMTCEPVVARVDWPLARAVTAMQQGGVNRVPVVDGQGQPVGILTRDDVLRVLAGHLRPAVAARRPPRGARMAPD
jgi:CBS domain-containing protein